MNDIYKLNIKKELQHLPYVLNELSQKHIIEKNPTLHTTLKEYNSFLIHNKEERNNNTHYGKSRNNVLRKIENPNDTEKLLDYVLKKRYDIDLKSILKPTIIEKMNSQIIETDKFITEIFNNVQTRSFS